MGGVAQRYREESDRRARKIPRLLRALRGPEWRELASLMERRRLELGALYRWPGPVGVPTAERSPSATGAVARPAAGSVLAVPPASAPDQLSRPAAVPGDGVPNEAPPQTPSTAVPAPAPTSLPASGVAGGTPGAGGPVSHTPPSHHPAHMGHNGDAPEPEVR